MNEKMNLSKEKQVSEKLEKLYEGYRGAGPETPAGFKLSKTSTVIARGNQVGTKKVVAARGRGNQVLTSTEQKKVVAARGRGNQVVTQKKVVAAPGRTEGLKTLRQDALKKFVPDKKYTKSVSEAGFTNLFNENADIEEIYKRIRSNIKNLREYYDLTQEDLADMIEVSRQYIGQLESGEKTPSLETLASLSIVLNTNVAMLISVDMPSHHVFYSDMLFKALSEKAKNRQLGLLKELIEHIENA